MTPNFVARTTEIRNQLTSRYARALRVEDLDAVEQKLRKRFRDKRLEAERRHGQTIYAELGKKLNVATTTSRLRSLVRVHHRLDVERI